LPPGLLLGSSSVPSGSRLFSPPSLLLFRTKGRIPLAFLLTLQKQQPEILLNPRLFCFPML
jgi:hypothetical protein